MLSALQFETAAPSATSAPNRADVACFIGYVARRPRAPLPAAVRAQLRAAGWIGGPWSRPDEDIEALWQVPVVCESWSAFSGLFAWEQRPLRAGTNRTCASYLGGAVRSFFAQGGTRAIVIRVGDPWPYLDGANRATQRQSRLRGLRQRDALADRPFDPTDPATWGGLEHLYGLAEVSHVCLPDLADACAGEPGPPAVVIESAAAPEIFVECSEHEPALPEDLGLRLVAAPCLDADGFSAWRAAVDHVRAFLAHHRRDALLLAALPLPQPDVTAGGTYAGVDWLGFLRASGLLEAEGSNEAGNGTAASAFVQLAWPWLQTTRSTDLPQQLEPAEGLLAGLLARNALSRGTYRSVAGSRLPDVIDCQPMPALGLGTDSPSARLAERVCLAGPEPDGIHLLSDVTSSPDPAWRGGGVSRLMAAVLRAARRSGEAHLFEASGEVLWTRVRRGLEDLLEDFWRGGGLGGATPREAYQVRCGRDTMSQNDLDNGRLRVEITVLPVAAVERITLVFDLAGGGAAAQLREVA